MTTNGGAAERNEKIYTLLQELVKKAKNSDYSFKKPFSKAEVETLFNSHIFGHREIILTIIVARLLDPKFKASKNFYECNPRAIFEGPIRKILRENGIPHKKSGPLNVAKNVQKINEDWADQKRGGDLAITVVQIVKKIEKASSSDLNNFAISFLKRYLQEAKKVEELKFVMGTQEDPIFLVNLCRDLIDEVPDGGTMPQKIVGLLLHSFVHDRGEKIRIEGFEDSVSTTNTTSKKPGDMMEIRSDGTEVIYEVTVKKFSNSRMLESYESVRSYDKESKIREVFVLCREQDLPDGIELDKSLSIIFGNKILQDVRYYFVNLYGWIGEKLFFMSSNGRNQFYKLLVEYVNRPNTSEKVKLFFNKWHSQ